jgi:hypothetical protein
MRAASTGATPPRATAPRRVASTCRQSSTVRNDARSIPRRSAGLIAAGGGNSYAASGRDRCGLRSSRWTAPARSAGRAARSDTRRLGLRIPGGRQRGLEQPGNMGLAAPIGPDLYWQPLHCAEPRRSPRFRIRELSCGADRVISTASLGAGRDGWNGNRAKSSAEFE